MLAPVLLLTLLCSGQVAAVETAPRIADREIIERLTKLEAGQAHLAAAIEAHTAALNQLRTDMQTQGQQLRHDMNQLRQDMQAQNQQLRQDMQAQNQQLRQDMQAQFDRLYQLMLGLLGAFTALVVATIGFALWDRRTMVRPFEDKVKVIEAELGKNRERLHSLLEALRSLGQNNKQVADVLRQFQLL